LISLGQAGAETARMHTIDLRPPSVPSLAVQSALRSLGYDLADLVRGGEPARAVADALTSGLRALSQDQAALAMQGAIALNAYIRANPNQLQEALARSGNLLAQIMTLARVTTTGAGGQPVADPRAGVSFLLQMLMQSDSRDLGRIQGLLGRLEALGAKVQVSPSQTRSGFVEILLLLGDPNSPEARRLRLDLRVGPSREAAAPPGAPAPEGGRTLARPEAQLFRQGEGQTSEERSSERGEGERRGQEGRAPEHAKDSSSRPEEFDYKYEMAYSPMSDGRVAPPGAAPGEALETDLLLLTYEPEKTRAWQLAHFAEKASSDSIQSARRGGLFSTTIGPAPDEVI
jgi:hypothetical protein